MHIRDIKPPDTVERKRKILSGLLAQKRSNRSFSEQVNKLPFTKDLPGVNAGIDDVTFLINSFSGNKTEYNKITTRLHHISKRISKLTATGDDEIEIICNELKLKMLYLESEFDERNTAPIPAVTVASVHLTTNYSNIPYKNVDVHKWNTFFNGKGLLPEFLEQIEMLRKQII